jgi:ABC-type branched-subunit amino acid transport system ATPase component
MPISLAETMRPTAFLTMSDVVAGYGGSPIVCGITAVLGAGEIVAVVGPNGAGKSTLLKAVAGLLVVNSGSIELESVNITNIKTNRLARMGIGFVPQNDDVFSPLTVRENLEMGGYLMKRSEVSDRIDEVVAHLPALKALMTRRAARLSGGERKMLAIGRALMNRPRVLLLDEPTSGLSAELSRRLLTEEVRGLSEDGTSVLLVEQKALAALEISNWAYVLALGQVVLSVSAPDLLTRPDLGEIFLGRVEGSGADDDCRRATSPMPSLEEPS